MTFGPWEIEDDRLLAAAARYERARKIRTSDILSIDREERSADISGSDSSLYYVTLEGCDCRDFERRGAPCKHMIRLAIELGIPFDIPDFDPYAAFEYDVQDDIDRIVRRWRAGQLTTDAATRCVNALRDSAKLAKRRPGKPKKRQSHTEE